jgi:hypothetical protein
MEPEDQPFCTKTIYLQNRTEGRGSSAVMAKEVFMTGSKKTNEAPDALLDAASKDAKITKTELSEEELKDVSGGKHVANIKWTPGSSSAG